jgi:hypothetical protein
MRARPPLDVDLEDKLLYGLTPMRLAYLLVALLGGFALWSSLWAPAPLRALACSIVVGTGAVAAWGRWKGRPVDGWIADLSIFVINTHRLVIDMRWLQRFRRNKSRSTTALPLRSPVAIEVSGRAPKAGATTVALELAACLGIKGYPVTEWSVTAAPTGHSAKPSASQPLISVVSVGGGRVCYLDRGSGPWVVGVIPEDDSVRRAAALNQATVVAFPDAPASKAISGLIDVITASV